MKQLLSKIPKPVLVFLVLSLALLFFVYKNPPKDECEIQAQVFDRNTKGILNGVKKNKKIQFAQISPLRDRCKEANSPGGCEAYFSALSQIVHELKFFKEKCMLQYAEENEDFVNHLSRALQMMSLVAWGEKPPGGASERLGWFNENHLRTFCGLKRSFLFLSGEENYAAIRDRIYSEYPDAWPEALSEEQRLPEERPKALKSAANPKGSLTKQQIFERSLFSIRCDLYL